MRWIGTIGAPPPPRQYCGRVLSPPISYRLCGTGQDIADAEARRRVVGRVLVGPDEWRDLWLFVINDFEDVRIDTFAPERGKWPPATDEILLERAALLVAKAKIGNSLMVRIPGGLGKELRLAGTIHAPGLAPAWMEGFAYGFITRETLATLGGTPYLDELRIVVDRDALDKNHIRSVTQRLQNWLARNGYPVSRLEVPEPGKHPHASQMATLLFLLEAFGLLALVLSGVLVANMISALLARQIRQIGVMKAVGAGTPQIAGLYLSMVTVLGAIALILGIPAGIMAGRAYATFAAGMLNFKIFSDAIPFPAFALQIGVGLFVPLLAAFFPVYRGSRITVRQAIGDYGAGGEASARPSSIAGWCVSVDYPVRS